MPNTAMPRSTSNRVERGEARLKWMLSAFIARVERWRRSQSRWFDGSTRLERICPASSMYLALDDGQEGHDSRQNAFHLSQRARFGASQIRSAPWHSAAPYTARP